MLLCRNAEPPRRALRAPGKVIGVIAANEHRRNGITGFGALSRKNEREPESSLSSESARRSGESCRWQKDTVYKRRLGLGAGGQENLQAHLRDLVLDTLDFVQVAVFIIKDGLEDIAGSEIAKLAGLLDGGVV